MSIKLGVIADDFTGASDMASFLVGNGLSTVQMNGVPGSNEPVDADAIVVSLKSRSNPASEAVAQSLAALQWLQQQGCNRFYFKYCSTFDSTADGNIGPVSDALMKALDTDMTVVAPALPVNGRTVYQGHLFVGPALLNESGMENHPVTPMQDANLLRLMEAQAEGRCGLVAYSDVAAGAAAVKDRLQALRDEGYRYAVVDCVADVQQDALAEAVADWPLYTGGSGFGGALARQWCSADEQAEPWFAPAQKTLILSGSCSLMTNKQVAAYRQRAAAQQIDVAACINRADEYVAELCDWVMAHQEDEWAPMIYATVPADELREIQAQWGKQAAGEAIERTLAAVAVQCHKAGINRIICAGGETSSLIVQQLGISGFDIGAQIAPGVPWLKSLDSTLYLALKSGNFGQEDFFSYAQNMEASA